MPAPDGGLAITLTPKYGSDVAATADSRLCDDNSARATAADLGTGLPATLTVSAGETTGKATMRPVLDMVVDHDECFAIQGSTAAAGWVAATGTDQFDTAHVLIKERPPGEPTGLAVEPGNAKLDLSWTAPATGVTEEYYVHHTSASPDDVANTASASGTDPSAAWVSVSRSGAGTSQSITGLANGTAYRVRVRAVNGGGRSHWVFGTGTPVAKTWRFQPSEYTLPPGSGTQIRITLSVPAPDGGLAFTLTRKLGTNVPGGPVRRRRGEGHVGRTSARARRRP